MKTTYGRRALERNNGKNMSLEGIQKVIEDKFEDWKASIKDTHIHKLIADNTIITGGCIASLLDGEPVNDFDVYMRTEEAAFLVAQYYCNTIPVPCYPEPGNNRITIILPSKKPIKKKKPKGGYNVAYISPLAITLTDKIQITVRFFGEPKEIHSNYDFVHCTGYWTSWNKELKIHKNVIDAVEKKKLIYVGSKYPVASLVRVKKFAQRGWRITANQMLKIAVQVSDLDLTDKEQLKEQLVGMYSKDLTKVVEDTKIDENGKVDRDSLFEAIDKHLKE